MDEAEPRSQEAITTAAADWPDVERLFGVRGEPSRCWCRFFELTNSDWSASTPEERKSQLRDKFDAGQPAPGGWVVRTSSGWLGSKLRGVSVMAAVPFVCGQGAQTFSGGLPVNSILSVLMAGWGVRDFGRGSGEPPMPEIFASQGPGDRCRAAFFPAYPRAVVGQDGLLAPARPRYNVTAKGLP